MIFDGTWCPPLSSSPLPHPPIKPMAYAQANMSGFRERERERRDHLFYLKTTTTTNSPIAILAR